MKPVPGRLHFKGAGTRHIRHLSSYIAKALVAAPLFQGGLQTESQVHFKGCSLKGPLCRQPHHLCQATWLEHRRNKDDVAGGVDHMRERLIEAEAEG